MSEDPDQLAAKADETEVSFTEEQALHPDLDVEEAGVTTAAKESDLPPQVPTTTTTQSRKRSTAMSIVRVAKELPRVEDHFSLEAPSSVVRFRRKEVRVYEQRDSQFVLEETARRGRGRGADGGGGGGGVTITVKQLTTSGNALRLLRLIYTLVAIFMGGFLFIFGLELLLFLFIDLATEAGAPPAAGSPPPFRDDGADADAEEGDFVPPLPPAAPHASSTPGSTM